MAGKKETLVVEHIPTQFRLDPKSEFESGRFSGIASVFGSIVDTTARYGVRTRFREGAFLRTINNSGNRVKILAQHNDTGIWIGLPTKLQETKDGLFVEASLNKTSMGLDYSEAIRHAASLDKLDALEMSIGFDALNHEMIEDEEDEEVFREVTEARLWEISVVNFGADRQTKFLEAAALETRLAPSPFEATLNSIRALSSDPEKSRLTREQYLQLTKELRLQEPPASPEKVRTEFERERQLSAIRLAEAEYAFLAIN
jgi:HK97 family phage prohead protease